MKHDLHTASILNDEINILAVTSVFDRWESPSQPLFSHGLTGMNILLTCFPCAIEVLIIKSGLEYVGLGITTGEGRKDTSRFEFQKFSI